MSRIHEAVRRSLARERAAAPGSTLDAGAGAAAVSEASLRPPSTVPFLPELPPDTPGAGHHRRHSVADLLEPPPSARPLDLQEPARITRQAAIDLDADGAEKLAIYPGADPVVIDQFRKLAGVLHQAQLEHGTRTVTVASAVASEGKTLTAINLAATLAASYRRRVLLIDVDLRGPSVHATLRCPLAPGLSDVLSGTAGPELPAIEITPGFFVLTAGTRTRDPISALSSEQFRQLLADAVAAFDWVVLDIPPVGALPDAGLLTAMSDTTVLVVQTGTAAYPVIQRAAEAIGPDRIIGVVLNMVAVGELDATYGEVGAYADTNVPVPGGR
jgi:capsular exopolysaccharide synthesis family protein